MTQSNVKMIMWAEAMETADREHLWPQLVHGFKDLSRLKLQDEVILSDAERLRMTQSNVKMLQRHFQADTLPWIERMRQKEQGLQSCLLGVMRIVEALEGKGCRLLLMKGEVELAEKLACYHQTVERIWSRAFSKGTKPGYDISCSSEFYWWWWLRLSFGINENTQSESC